MTWLVDHTNSEVLSAKDIKARMIIRRVSDDSVPNNSGHGTFVHDICTARGGKKKIKHTGGTMIVDRDAKFYVLMKDDETGNVLKSTKRNSVKPITEVIPAAEFSVIKTRKSAHADCSHESTKAARAKCRAERKSS